METRSNKNAKDSLSRAMSFEDDCNSDSDEYKERIDWHSIERERKCKKENLLTDLLDHF
jgi:hypothetical protein